MNFRSDNESPAAPEILAALQEANSGHAYAYGEDGVTSGMKKRFRETFETDLEVFPVATGTAANALSIAQLTPAYGSVLCHQEAHLHSDECGAPEFYSGGAKVIPLSGELAKISPRTLRNAVARMEEMGVHESQPSAVSLSQATELGTVYKLDEIGEISRIARGRGLGLHMDGARLANAVRRLGCTPAELTWKAGVDILSFGATKNGAMAAEAVVVFNSDRAAGLASRHKRAGHLFSKMRFISAQLEAYLKDDLWLQLAERANRAADALSAGFRRLASVEVLYPVEANEVFVKMPPPLADGLKEAGYEFHLWPGSRDHYRLVTCFTTRVDEVNAFLAVAKRLADGLKAGELAKGRDGS